MSEEEKNVLVPFQWQVLRPDIRQYKQQSIELSPMNVAVGVNIPASMVISESGGSLMLTPEGMRYAQAEIEKLFAEAESKPEAEGWGKDPEFAKAVDNATDWDNSPDGAGEMGDAWGEPVNGATLSAQAVREVLAEEAKSDDEGWGDSPVFDDEPAAGNQPDAEQWNDEGWES